MDNLCADDSCDFVVSLGDNFYDRGVKNIEDKRWEGVYENVYGRSSSRENLKQLDFYSIMGNHDYKGNVTAQLQYPQQIESKWIYPHFWYTIEENKGPDLSLKIFMIDTQIMRKDKDAKKLPDYETYDYFTEQQKWLDQELENCEATYCIVAGHHPMYSIGYHGPQQDLLDNLKPLLLKHKVDAYISGHDHVLTHYNHEDVHYFISGLGRLFNLTKRNLNNPQNPPTMYHSYMVGERLGLTFFEVTEEKLEVKFISGKGDVHYTATIWKKTAV